MLKSIILISAGALAFASAAQAMPLSSDVGAPAPHITLVAGGCGIGFHRGPYGGCRRNMGPAAPYWRGPGWRFRNGCWRGPYGRVHCR